jgi:hypothetical protein
VGVNPYFDLLNVARDGLGGKSVIILAYDPDEFFYAQFNSDIRAANQEVLLGRDLLALEDHPGDPEIVNGVSMNQGTYALALIQSLSDLNQKARAMAGQGFYDTWPEEYLQGLLKDIGGLVSNPFDSAIGSVRSINKELEGLRLRADLVNQGIELSSKQLKEYSKIGNEVAVTLKRMGIDPSQGDGLKMYNNLLKESQNSYLKSALEATNYRAAEKELARQHKETAAAVRFLSDENARM